MTNGPAAPAGKSSAYGLPCAACHLYYPADLDACPTCQSQERVAPVMRIAAGQVPQNSTETAPPRKDDVAQAGKEPKQAGTDLDQEREQFLREFKSELVAVHAEVTNAPAYTCKLEHNHSSGSQPAEICQPCHERLQGRLDVCEAALHMDLKEAAQIIYDAVWADPSDPSKTYRNAASALLSELRKRAGMNAVRGSFHPMAH
ncbi:MAG: hypothetical protein WBQ08_11540 [Candidatus Sulfotelmatobacter sp.]